MDPNKVSNDNPYGYDDQELAMWMIKKQVIRARQYRDQKAKEISQEEDDKKSVALKPVKSKTISITEYLEIKWVSRIIKVVLFFMIGIAISINFQTSYFVVVDYLSLFGFSILSYVGCVGQTDHLRPEPIDHPFSWRRFVALSNFITVNNSCWLNLESSFSSGATWSNFFGLLCSAKTAESGQRCRRLHFDI